MTTQSNRRAEEEIARFTEKYPDTDLDSVPESVWNRVKEGADLSEAYGAHRKKLREEDPPVAFELHSREQRRRLPPDNTLSGCGIGDGARLILV